MMYRAPELFSCEIGSTLSTAVDVWSLGVCLYEFLLLENPFNKIYEQGGSIALATQSPEMIKWDSGGRDLNQKTIDIIKKALTVNPDIRPTTSELRQKMEEVISSWDNLSIDPTRELTDEEFDEAMRSCELR